MTTFSKINSKWKRILNNYYEYIVSDDEKVVCDVNDIITLCQKYPQNLSEIHYIFKYLKTNKIAALPPIIPLTSKEQIKQQYLDIIQQCMGYTNYAHVLNHDVYDVMMFHIPKIILLSYQILITCDFSQIQVVPCLVFNHIIHICVMNDKPVQPLIIQDVNYDLHLKTLDGKMCYKNDDDNDSLIHHINANMFDNRKCNLIPIISTLPTVDASTKHHQLHKIL